MNTADFKIFVPLLKANKGPDGKMRFHGIASSSIKDRHGDTITRSALSEMERSANENMTIFLNHSYNVPEDVAGSVESAVLRNHPTDPDIQDLAFNIVVNSSNDRAVKAWEAIDGGTKLGLSIGARIPDGGATRSKDTGRYIIDHVDLLETSIVGVPANPRSWVEYAVKALNAHSETIQTSFGEVTILESVGEPEQTVEEVLAKESEGTGVVMEGIEAPADGTMVELTSDEDVELEKAKKPAGHEHPHAHEHDHGHEHWNGIVHAHEHNHTHAHEHDDGHEHIDDKQGSEHDHSHMNQTSENHAHEEDGAAKADDPTLTGDELAAHIAEFQAPPPDDTESSDGAAPAPQEAPSESVPENGDAPAEADDAKELDLEPTLVASIQTNNELMLTITRELVEAKTALVRMEQERDQALVLAEKAMNDTSALLNRLAATPMGKRTQVTDAVTDFESLKSVYGEGFVDLLKKKD